MYMCFDQSPPPPPRYPLLLPLPITKSLLLLRSPSYLPCFRVCVCKTHCIGLEVNTGEIICLHKSSALVCIHGGI